MFHLQSLQTVFVNQEASVEFGKMSFLLLLLLFFRKTLGCTYLPYSNSKLIPLALHMLLKYDQRMISHMISAIKSRDHYMIVM